MERDMPRSEIIVMGASMGGVRALCRLVRGLPGDFAGAILIVLHTAPDGPALLAELLSEAGNLPAGFAEDGQKLRAGHIYVAPPDHHLLIRPGGFLRLSRGPKENFARPAIDPLFRSAALAYRERATGVILTGALDDGTSGLAAIKEMGGIAIVQDPDEASVPSMPRSALRNVKVDHCLPLKDIPPLLVELTRDIGESQPMSEPSKEREKDLKVEMAIASDERERHPQIEHLGTPSIYACPECNGNLLRIRDAVPPRFRCYTGHGYTLMSLETSLKANVEDALWNAIRALEEYAYLLDEAAKDQDETREAAEQKAEASRARDRAGLVRETLAR
jgi:two-component system, chemotaxis family, protein-glutamate methylesterase/glutaminase